MNPTVSTEVDLLYYAGPLPDRVWLINRDGSGNRRLYERNVEKNERITHESWMPGMRELAFVDWPNGIRCVHVDTGGERRVTSFNAWHAICNRITRGDATSSKPRLIAKVEVFGGTIWMVTV